MAAGRKTAACPAPGTQGGCVTVEKTVEIAARMGIEYLTVYGFSTENWKRSSDEVGALMQLFRFIWYVC